nr:MAG TPA: hypothetical protein [Caudoviricetes sp.]
MKRSVKMVNRKYVSPQYAEIAKGTDIRSWIIYQLYNIIKSGRKKLGINYAPVRVEFEFGSRKIRYESDFNFRLYLKTANSTDKCINITSKHFTITTTANCLHDIALLIKRVERKLLPFMQELQMKVAKATGLDHSNLEISLSNIFVIDQRLLIQSYPFGIDKYKEGFRSLCKSIQLFENYELKHILYYPAESVSEQEAQKALDALINKIY